MLTIALSKGKMLDLTLDVFRRAGYAMGSLSTESRRLVFPCPEIGMTFLIVRPTDVPTYVEYGAADVGIVGKDVLMEQDSDVYEPLDLGFGACRIAVAALKGQASRDRLSSKIRVATKYPKITERYFNQRGVPVEIIKLYGSIELAPLVGLADRVVDLVETGNTLKAHGLVEVECIAQSTARLIVNRASLKLKHAAVTVLIKKLRAVSRASGVSNRRPAQIVTRGTSNGHTDAHMKIVASTERAFLPALKKVASRARVQGAAVEKTVKSILQAVERGDDKAVLRYTKQFDRVSMKDTELRVTPEEIKEAYFHIRKDEGDALRFAAQRITSFHERQRIKTWMYQDNEATLGQVVTPVDAVGVYVPGGKAVYPSSVLMCAIPAKVAGVSRVVMCTPPQKGSINPYLLVAADIAGVTEIYRVGGVQAVGAMAYGTKTIRRVDKIVGPGNIYVATAKRLLYGTVGIDMVAGPSELLVVADGDAKPAHVAADLLCEAEHDEDAQVYLVTTSAQLAKDVVRLIGSQLKGLQREKIAAKSIARHSVAFVVATMDEAIDVANEIAPEHLTLSVDEPFDYLEKIRHAGALFLGRYTPPSVADYVAGPNHVLPTGGSARFFSALSVHDYLKVSNIVHYTREELSKVKDHLVRLAHIEGFDAHAKSAQSRFS